MSIEVDQERRFYDVQYSRFLSLPPEELRINLPILRRDLANPRHPIFERRNLHLRAMAELLRTPVKGLKVLDYGCGTGDWGLMLATEGAHATLLDLSPAAIEVCLRRASASGVSDRVRGEARDASDLTCFDAGEFDLIYAGAAVHHTLKYSNALEELIRVLKPGGRLVLAETYGNNALLNAVRRVRARLAGEPEDAGEEIILGDRELSALAVHFSEMRVEPFGLLSMAKRFFRGRFHRIPVPWVLAALEATDRILLRLIPPLKTYCGEVVIVARR